MNITNFQKITSILHKYEFKEHDGSMNAEHDEIHFGGPNESQVSSSDIDELDELGCTWDDSYDCWHVFA